jgi:hypothetical protein
MEAYATAAAIGVARMQWPRPTAIAAASSLTLGGAA